MDIISIIRKTSSTAADLLSERYTLMRVIAAVSPVGRRNLCELSGFTERETRDMLTQLSQSKLICTCRAGVSLTEEGRAVLGELFSLLSPQGKPLIRASHPALIERAALAGEAACRALAESDTLLIDDTVAVRYAVGAMRREDCRFSVLGTASHTPNDNYGLLAQKLLQPRQAPPILPKQARELAAFVGSPEAVAYAARLEKVTAMMLSVRTMAEAMKATDVAPRLINLLLDQGAVAEIAGYYLREDGKIVYTSLPLTPSPELLSELPIYLIASEKSGEKEIRAVLNRCNKAILFS